MKKNIFKIFPSKGFSIVELLISIVIFSLILLAVISFLLSMNSSNLKTMSTRDALDNAKGALEEISYEIRSAKGIYTPTTTSNQLSLETLKYLPDGEATTFIDFFLCGTSVCIKKEGSSPVILTSASVQATNLTFSQISTGTSKSVKISLTINSGGGSGSSSSVITSTASLRSY